MSFGNSRRIHAGWFFFQVHRPERLGVFRPVGTHGALGERRVDLVTTYWSAAFGEPFSPAAAALFSETVLQPAQTSRVRNSQKRSETGQAMEHQAQRARTGIMKQNRQRSQEEEPVGIVISSAEEPRHPPRFRAYMWALESEETLELAEAKVG